MPNEKPEHHGEHYTDSEIALILLFRRSAEAKRRLADFLGRSPHAVDFVWRWAEGAAFPEDAYNEIRRQVARVEEILGPEVRGVVPVDSWEIPNE